MMSLKWNFPSYYEWFKLYYYTNDKVHSDIMGNEPYRAIITVDLSGIYTIVVTCILIRLPTEHISFVVW